MADLVRLGAKYCRPEIDTSEKSSWIVSGMFQWIVDATPWWRTNGVRTNGAAAKVMDFDGLGKKVRPGTFGKIKLSRLMGVPKRSLCQKTTTHAVTPLISADRMCPFPNASPLAGADAGSGGANGSGPGC